MTNQERDERLQLEAKKSLDDFFARRKQAEAIPIGVYGQKWQDELGEIEERMRATGAKDVNPYSLRQVAYYIYRTLKLRQVEGESVSNRTLSLLAEQHEYPRLLLEHRRVSEKYKMWKRFMEYVADDLKADDVKIERQTQ